MRRLAKALKLDHCEAERHEEAKNIPQIVLASPFEGAYPQWRETREEIELRVCRPSRTRVVVRRLSSEATNLLRVSAPQWVDSDRGVESISGIRTSRRPCSASGVEQKRWSKNRTILPQIQRATKI